MAVVVDAAEIAATAGIAGNPSGLLLAALTPNRRRITSP
jgi:hypothetical protein